MSLSEFLRKTFADQKSRAAEAGQALLEYILVLILTVSIILGLLYQFNDAFKTFLDNYFGDYIACLLETGELPGLGGDGPTSSECVVPDMNVAAGTALDNSATGSGDNSGGGGDGSSSSDSSSSGGSDGDGGSGSGRNSRPARFNSGGGSGNGEALGSSAATSRPASIRRSIRNNANSNNPDSSGGFESDSSEGGAFGGRRGRTIRRKRVIYLGDDYLTKDAKKNQRSAVVSRVRPPNKKGGTSDLRKAEMKLEVPERDVARIEKKETSLGFGSIIKFMLIGGILIAIFIFLGGQAMQIKKGWQKSE